MKISKFITRATSLIGFGLLALITPTQWFTFIGQVVVAFLFATTIEFAVSDKDKDNK